MTDHILSEKKANGIKWTTWGMIVKIIVQFLVTAGLARLLSPAEFGIMALARTFLQFGGYISNAGINRALVQKSELSDKDIATAVSLTLMLGGISCLLMIMISPLAGLFYENVQIAQIICVTSFSYLFSALAMADKGILQREMNFQHIVYADTWSYILGYALTTLSLAWFGFGVWSIAVGTVMQSVVLWAIQRYYCKRSIHLGWDRRAARQLIRFGGGVTVISIFEYLGGCLDVVLSGKIWGENEVGLYTKASQLVTLPIEYISNALTAPMFPAMCSSKNDLVRLRREYISDFLLACVIEFSVCVGMAFTAREMVEIVLGKQWLSAVNLFIVFCVAHAFNYSNTVIGMALEAVGKLKVKLFLQWSQIAVLVAGIFLFRSWNMLGVSFAMLIAQVYKFLGIQVVMGRVLQWSAKDKGTLFLNLIYVVVIQAVLQSITSWLVNLLEIPVIISLLCHVICGAVVLLFVCIICPTSWIKEYVNIKKIILVIIHREVKK